MTAWIALAVVAVLAWLAWQSVGRRIFTAARVVAGTRATLARGHAEAARMATLSMGDFLREWMAIASRMPDGEVPVLRRPADAAAIAAAEIALGGPLPDELRTFYEHADGIDWSAADYRRDLVPVAALALAASHSPSLAAQARASWEQVGREEGDPEGLAVTSSTDLLKMMSGGNDFVLPFDDVDAMLALEAPRDGSGVVMVFRHHARLPVGTVLEVENGTATRHDGLRHWLGSDMASIDAILGGIRPA
jgi:hypothetical protein